MGNSTGNADNKSVTTSKNDKTEEDAGTSWDENKKSNTSNLTNSTTLENKL